MDTKPACRRPLVQLVPRRVPAAKPCNAAPASTSSSIVSTGHCSSSDNESLGGGELDCSGGWPSTLSVLETPERRRLRRLRTNNTHNPVIQNLIDEEGNSLLLDNSSFMSSPPMQPNMEHVFSPPTLKTPKAVPQRLKNVHISCSPMRSFYCRQSPTQKPRLSSNSGSSSGRVPLGRVNRVLELPLPSSSNNRCSTFNTQQQQENLVSSSSSSVEWPREESGYASSSFNTSSRLDDLLSFDHSNGSHVETPSKGLGGGMDSETSLSEFGGMCSLDMMHHSSSTPLKHSSNLLLSLNEGFIPEQASGPLEASVLDGINPLLDNFFLLPPPNQSTSPAKHPTNNSLKRRLGDSNTHYATTSEVPAKRCALTRFHKAKSAEATESQSSISSVSLSLDGEGMDENSLVEMAADNFMVSSLGEEKWRLLVGETPDQLLVTSWAKTFMRQHHQLDRPSTSLRNSRALHTLSAGLLQLSPDYYFKLD